jgi:hypothetical protein
MGDQAEIKYTIPLSDEGLLKENLEVPTFYGMVGSTRLELVTSTMST